MIEGEIAIGIRLGGVGCLDWLYYLYLLLPFLSD